MHHAVYSDEERPVWELDPQALDSALRIGPTSSVSYENPEISYVVDCIKRRTIDEKELAVEQCSVFIASDKEACLENGRAVNPSDPDATCLQRGAAPPVMRFRFGPINIEERVIILTGRAGTTDDLEPHITWLASHEGLHANTVLHEEESRRDENEQWMKHHEIRRATYIDALDPIVTWTD